MHLSHPYNIRFLLLILSLVFLCACTSKQSVVSSDNEPANQWAHRVEQQKQTAECQTARVSVNLSQGQKNISCSGTLRMKRDDVVQLSLTFLGVEVGRLECTPTDVLLIDRINKQYIRAPYSDVDFLAAAGLDFYALQSLFRGELFVPGTKNTAQSLHRFHATEAGEHILLALTDAPELEYNFIVTKKNATISRFEATPKQANTSLGFVCRYGNIGTLDNKPVPQQLDMEVKGTSEPLQLSLSLSRLSTNANWETRTTPKASYKQLTNTRQIINRLLQLAQ
ncbi:MAG: DUF4292 domain-containing protein [Alloprevotella sp.]|nr:DUF4292 domain-containing protein [Alloprevotella sp.]